MKRLAHRILILVAGAMLMPLPSRASAAESVAFHVSDEAAEAWKRLQSADAKIGQLLVAGSLVEVAAEAAAMRTALTTILRGIRTNDEAAIRRLNSAGREILNLAERLAAVATTGNRARAQTVFANLHRYVEFVQAKLPPSEPGSPRRTMP